VTFLTNLPAQEQLTNRWQHPSWHDFVDAIWKTKNQLAEKEREYRNLAIAIAQIGIGIGGMVVGLICFGVSLVLALVPLLANRG
jgi:hypothetical protein